MGNTTSPALALPELPVSHWQSGFNDAQEGKPPSPPDRSDPNNWMPPNRGYMNGHDYGCKQKRPRHA